ncbi:hypothetical protein [Kitasatospora sp. NPDC094011]|uniref:hypothetical protein n=1 Tax=Kitasatospora sp. NPDC094011 TaxID=3364090 RepID=UPI0038224D64
MTASARRMFSVAAGSAAADMLHTVARVVQAIVCAFASITSPGRRRPVEQPVVQRELMY